MRDAKTVAFLAERCRAADLPDVLSAAWRGDAGFGALRSLLDAGLPIALGSGDPLLFGADVTASTSSPVPSSA
ncbi:hypothetical protein JOF56_009678 [Kibdelosporangium banguiense]|uniref:Amidohydrolase n=1 Tax=Kibdelosporangium banguiense TaxID=1365924 RepID=A0ABS4TY33_9PSEU|nr:hypothetical protein [Kibdelosporangium banguiense]MBP2329293.1 hypothetical protein [Kibdelosporangium banguiense]